MSNSARGSIQFPTFGIQVATGNYRNWLSENKFAANPSVGTSFEDVWNNGGTLSYLSSAETMNIVSTDTNDDGDPAGTGARTLEIFGLDGNYDLINETVTLNGTTNVTTVNSYLRVHRMIVRTAGSGGGNAGVITATASSAGTVQANIDIGDNQTLKSQYTVPNGYYMAMVKIEASCAKGDEIEVRLEARPENQVFQVKFVFQLFQQTEEILIDPPRIFESKTDIRLRAKNIGGSTVNMAAAYDFYLIPSDQVNL